MRIHVGSHLEKRVWFNRGVGVQENHIPAATVLQGLVVCGSKPAIRLVGDQPHLGKFLADYPGAPILRGIIDDENLIADPL